MIQYTYWIAGNNIFEYIIVYIRVITTVKHYRTQETSTKILIIRHRAISVVNILLLYLLYNSCVRLTV